MSIITDSEKIEILYKKNLGVPNTLPTSNIASEPAKSAVPTIIPDLQVFAQAIPSKAPIDLILDSDFNQSNGKRYYSNSYNYIVKYEDLLLTADQFQRSYVGVYTINSESINLLSKTIPFNYDPINSYNITLKLYNSTIGSYQVINMNDTNIPWNYDKDAGYITFYGSSRNIYLGSTNPPLMTFWRYEGNYGLSGSGSDTWDMSGNNISYTNGNVGIGNPNPMYNLDISGNMAINGDITGSSWYISSDGSANFNGTVNMMSFNIMSDYRVKDNVQLLDINYNVDKLNPVTYFNNKTEKQDIGLIAHEVQEYYPYLVSGIKDSEKFQSVNYIGLIPILIKEIQTIKQRISIQEKINSNLKKKFKRKLKKKKFNYRK